MTLLNGLLAFGAAAFTIPLIIHLQHRSQYQIIDWGAMHLLQTARNLNSRQLQWQQIILLLLRCALPVLLAMAMARPLLHPFLSADGRSAMSVAIVIDDSMSMFATNSIDVGNSNPTRFSVACRSATDVLKELPEGSNAFVLLGGTTPEALVGQVPEELASKLETVGLRSFPASKFGLEESVRTSVQWLSKSPHPKRQLILITDFQKHEWSDRMGGQMSGVAKLLESQTIRPQLLYLNVGPSNEANASLQESNLSVDSIEVKPSLLSVAKKASIQITLGNHGTTKCDSFLAAVFVNDIEIDRQEVSIASSSTTILRTHWLPKQSGDHEIRVQILRGDNLMADNRLSTAVVVQKPIPILLVDGDQRSEAMRSETDFIRLALSPFSLVSDEKGDAFQTKTIQPHDLSESLLANYRAVFLCNVAEVSEKQQEWLHDFVEQGNGLIVFLGDKVQTEQYQKWTALANNGLRIANFATRIDTQSYSAGESTLRAGRVKMQQIEFDAIRELSPVSLASLASVRFEHLTPIALDPAALSNPSDASVAMRFEDDQAWILESRIGEGRSLWISNSCDDADSNLPTRSIYVPLIQKLAAFVCNANPPATSLVAGDVWTRKIRWSSSATRDDPQTVHVTNPQGIKVSLPFTDDGILRFGETRLLGAYYASVDRKGANQIVVCAMSKDSHSAEESTLTFLTQDEQTRLATSSNSTISTNVHELLNQSKADWRGREAWTWIWAALVLCFVVEMAFEQSISPRLKSRSTSHFGKAVQGTHA